MLSIKELLKESVEESKKLNEIEISSNNKLKARLISILIPLFFVVPLFLMVINLLFLGNYDLGMILISLIIWIYVFLSHFVYYDVLKYYNKEIKEIKFRTDRILLFICCTIITIVLLVLF